MGNPGDAKPVGEDISELRIDHGPGYRVYFLQRGMVLVMLLCGGDKHTQAADIADAKALGDCAQMHRFVPSPAADAPPPSSP